MVTKTKNIKYVTTANLDHAGTVVEEGFYFKAECPCGFEGLKRKFRIEAYQDLYKHYKEIGSWIIEVEHKGNRHKF